MTIRICKKLWGLSMFCEWIASICRASAAAITFQMMISDVLDSEQKKYWGQFVLWFLLLLVCNKITSLFKHSLVPVCILWLQFNIFLRAEPVYEPRQSGRLMYCSPVTAAMQSVDSTVCTILDYFPSYIRIFPDKIKNWPIPSSISSVPLFPSTYFAWHHLSFLSLPCHLPFYC